MSYSSDAEQRAAKKLRQQRTSVVDEDRNSSDLCAEQERIAREIQAVRLRHIKDAVGVTSNLVARQFEAF